MNETVATDQEILKSIENITFFLDEKGLDHAKHGIYLLKAEHPHLDLREGEIDLLVVTKNEADEDGEETFSVGWIGGGQVKGVWAETRGGVVIDPWLDERIRIGDAGAKMEPLPVIFRSREHDGPLDVVYQRGYSHNRTLDTSLHNDYRAWLFRDEAEPVTPTRVRVLLGPKGVGPMIPHSRWAQAVQKVDRRGVPPMREAKVPMRAATTTDAPEKAADAEPKTTTGRVEPLSQADDKKAAKIRERQEVVAQAVTDMTQKRPLSVIKALVAAGAGISLGYGIIHLFG